MRIDDDIGDYWGRLRAKYKIIFVIPQQILVTRYNNDYNPLLLVPLLESQIFYTSGQLTA